MPYPVAACRGRAFGSSAYNPAVLNLDLWLEARSNVYSDAGSTMPCVDLDPIYNWNGLGGTTINASQATLANRPIWTTDGGKPVVKFADGTDCFTFASALTAAQNGPMSVVIVAKCANTNDVIIAVGNGSSPQWRPNGSGAGNFEFFDGSTVTDKTMATASTNWKAYGTTTPGGGIGTLGHMYEDGTLLGTAAYRTDFANVNARMLYQIPGTVLSFANGMVKAVFGKKSEFTDAQVLALSTYGLAL